MLLLFPVKYSFDVKIITIKTSNSGNSGTISYIVTDKAFLNKDIIAVSNGYCSTIIACRIIGYYAIANSCIIRTIQIAREASPLIILKPSTTPLAIGFITMFVEK